MKSLKEKGLYLNLNDYRVQLVLGIAGLAGSIIAASHASIKAYEYVQKNNITKESFKKSSDKEKLKVCFDIGIKYVPTLLLAGGTTYCMLKGAQLYKRQLDALLWVGQHSSHLVDLYRQKLPEMTKKGDELVEKIESDIYDYYTTDEDGVIDTFKGDTLFFESFAGTTFRSDLETIRRAVNDVNYDIIHDFFVSFNTWRYALGLPEVMVGDNVGWSIDNQLEVLFRKKELSDGETIIIIEYLIPPDPQFNVF